MKLQKYLKEVLNCCKFQIVFKFQTLPVNFKTMVHFQRIGWYDYILLKLQQSTQQKRFKKTAGIDTTALAKAEDLENLKKEANENR